MKRLLLFAFLLNAVLFSTTGCTTEVHNSFTVRFYTDTEFCKESAEKLPEEIVSLLMYHDCATFNQEGGVWIPKLVLHRLDLNDSFGLEVPKAIDKKIKNLFGTYKTRDIISNIDEQVPSMKPVKYMTQKSLDTIKALPAFEDHQAVYWLESQWVSDEDNSYLSVDSIINDYIVKRCEGSLSANELVVVKLKGRSIRLQGCLGSAPSSECICINGKWDCEHDGPVIVDPPLPDKPCKGQKPSECCVCNNGKWNCSPPSQCCVCNNGRWDCAPKPSECCKCIGDKWDCAPSNPSLCCDCQKKEWGDCKLSQASLETLLNEAIEKGNNTWNNNNIIANSIESRNPFNVKVRGGVASNLGDYLNKIAANGEKITSVRIINVKHSSCGYLESITVVETK